MDASATASTIGSNISLDIFCNSSLRMLAGLNDWGWMLQHIVLTSLGRVIETCDRGSKRQRRSSSVRVTEWFVLNPITRTQV
eukprot:1436235-Amphidinium_carterae.1